ncbi:MAG: transposase [Anaerolineae bacterium]|nr:transposase [Anaerolineae bacterium]
MKFDPERHHRRSIRLQGFDYGSAGAYFVTICVNRREGLLGEVVDGVVQLSDYGVIVGEVWDGLPMHYPHIDLDAYVIMPNHVHGIIVIDTAVGHALSEIVRGFKTYSARSINQKRNVQGVSVWQRNYYEQVIRSEKSLHAIREYIDLNPSKWMEDIENPARDV